MIEQTPVPSILKKPSKFGDKKLWKLDASIANYSQVEISPGLFVKRPSSKTKKEPPETAPPSEHLQPGQLEHKAPTALTEHNEHVEIKHEMGPESPQMPKLKTIDLKKIMKEKQVAEATQGRDYKTSCFFFPICLSKFQVHQIYRLYIQKFLKI